MSVRVRVRARARVRVRVRVRVKVVGPGPGPVNRGGSFEQYRSRAAVTLAADGRPALADPMRTPRPREMASSEHGEDPPGDASEEAENVFVGESNCV